MDTTNYLGTGESLQSSPAPTIAVTSNSNNSTITGVISSGPTVSGNFILFTLLGSALQQKQSYTLIFAFNTTATKRLQAKLNVNAVI